MPEVKLSLEQQAVVGSTDFRLVVTAAAGAGKTRVLVERYLRHVLEEQIAPEKILTITFTRKAAAEMKKRIVDALRALGRHTEAQAAETGPIQTIHSFCERLLRENSLEAGLDPQFEILSESQSRRLIVESIREALASPLDETPAAEALVSSLAGQRRYNDGHSPYALLEASLETVLREIRGTGITTAELAKSHESPETLQRVWEECIEANQNDHAVEDALPQIEGDLQKRLQAAWKQTHNRIPPWLRGQIDPIAETSAATYTCALVQLACEAWLRLGDKMETLQALDFTDLEARAVRLLGRNEQTRIRLKNQFQVVMVDEAQDLNPIQHALLDSLGSDQRLIVGDAQQSIYGFRQAEVELFKQMFDEKTRRLSKNYRSVQGILNFVDHSFSSWSVPGYEAMTPLPTVLDFDAPQEQSYSGVELWDYPTKDIGDTGKFVQQLLTEGVAPNDITILTRDSNASGQIKNSLDRERIPCRIAGGSERFYTRMEVRDLANALVALADPYDDFALLACLRSPMVSLSLDSIVELGSSKPVIEALETFEPSIEDDAPKLQAFKSWFLPLKGYADRLSAWEVLSELYATSGYLQSLARKRNAHQVLANVRKLLMLAAEEPELGPREYADRIREIQELRHKEGDAPSEPDDAMLVTIMTIHKAKGLEFPVVVLPQTNTGLTKQKRDVVVDAKLKLLAVNFDHKESLFYKFLCERKKTRERQEELRVLYVAMTRAKERLCLAMYPASSKDTVSKMLLSLVGESPNPTILLRRLGIEKP